MHITRKAVARLVASKTARVIVGTLTAISIICAFIWAFYPSPWSGFGSYINPKGEFQRYKTLWDWMQLLIVPLALAVLALWFTHRRESLARELEESRTREDRELEESRTREERLQTYFDRMTELMLDKGLRRSEPGAEVRDIARARTLTALRRLDGERKGALLRFLREADLITATNNIIMLDEADLSGADLSGANLSVADLSGADLSGANLSVADLSGADLSGANLSGADLSGADLSGANLSGADLSGANLSIAFLRDANLRGANLSGADLRGARLRGADLRDAILSGADLSEANLSGADLSEAKDLTQSQVDSAKGSEDTRLPTGLVRPRHWANTPM